MFLMEKNRVISFNRQMVDGWALRMDTGIRVSCMYLLLEEKDTMEHIDTFHRSSMNQNQFRQRKF